jgi:hypothetical protein
MRLKRLLLPLVGLLAAGAFAISTLPVAAQAPCVGAGPGYEKIVKPGVVLTVDTHHLNICGAKNVFMGTFLKWKTIPADLALRITQPNGKVAYIDNNNPPGNYESYLAWAPLAPGDWTFEVINKSDYPVTYNLNIDFWYSPIFP